MKARFLQQKPPSKGLVVDLPLTHFVTGAVLFDETAGGFNGTATNSPVFKYPGMDFVAASSMYIDIGTGPTSTKTISLWVKQDDVSGNEYPLDLNGTDYISIESGVVTINGIAGASLYVNGIAGTSGVTTITALAWHHIAITDATANDANDFDIGLVTAAYFDGVISDVRLYSRVLGATEIFDIYNLQKFRYQT